MPNSVMRDKNAALKDIDIENVQIFFHRTPDRLNAVTCGRCVHM